jgi:tetratricopeptide (TPR) repeat protein
VKTLISGQAASAVCFESQRIYSIHINAPDVIRERREWEICHLFSYADDVIEIDCPTIIEVQQHLRVAWAKDRALRLLLILIDKNEDNETKQSLLLCLEDLFKIPEVENFVASHLYSKPLPSVADLQRASELCTSAQLTLLPQFISNLANDQREIKLRFDAWQNLPLSLFGGEDEKLAFYRKAVREEAFRLFVQKSGNHDTALVFLLLKPEFRGDKKAREILETWAAPFKSSSIGVNFENYVNEQEQAVANHGDESRNRGRSGREILSEVERQKRTIKNLLRSGDDERAFRFVDEMVLRQRRTSNPIHIAKSLCDLAQFSKEIGLPELQCRFAMMAINEAPNDAWSHSTLGDAQRALGLYEEAQNSYSLAGSLGDARISLLGRAELFKDVGHLSESLSLYDKCIDLYKDDIVIMNGRSAVLAMSGHLTDALKAYDFTIGQFPNDIVSLGGRAQVLRRMGRLKESLQSFDHIIKHFLNDQVAQDEQQVLLNNRAQVLRDLGRVRDAKEEFYRLMRRFPHSVVSSLSYAKACRDLGEFDEAIRVYSSIILKRKWAQSAHVGLADTYRKMGRAEESIKTYNDALSLFPNSTSAKNGLALALMLKGDYDAALRFISPYLPASFSEWLSYHTLGIFYMRSGDEKKAEEVFHRGCTENPWINQRQNFKVSLASLRIHQRRHQEAASLTKQIINPSLKPIAKILNMHSTGAMRKRIDIARQRVTLSDGAPPYVLDLSRDVFNFYFPHQGKRKSHKKENEMINKEFDALLLIS